MYDILIIGGGPAGISAGIYAKRSGRNVAILEKVALGGQLNIIGKVENYAGFKSIEGPELSQEFYNHAKALDIPVIYDEVVDFDFDGDEKKVIGRKETYHTLSIILALGSNCRELNIEGESRFKGNGVSYCAVCDGRFFKDKNVAVIGSGDSAFSDALYLSPLANHVYILTKSYLKLHNYSLEEVEDKKNITLLQNAMTKSINGKESVEEITFVQSDEEKSLDVDGVFVAIGRKPDTDMLKGKLELSEKGYIICDDKMQTSVEGVYVCGDIREGSIKQISTAVGDGAIAGSEASKYVLRKLFQKK